MNRSAFANNELRFIPAKRSLLDRRVLREKPLTVFPPTPDFLPSLIELAVDIVPTNALAWAGMKWPSALTDELCFD
jgi:hypothetical protein